MFDERVCELSLLMGKLPTCISKTLARVRGEEVRVALPLPLMVYRGLHRKGRRGGWFFSHVLVA